MKIKVVFKNGVVVDCEVESINHLENRFGDKVGISYVPSETGVTPFQIKYDEIAGIFEVK